MVMNRINTTVLDHQAAGRGGGGMYWLKACQKCGGDLYESADMYGEYLGCMQCGRYFSKEELAHNAAPAAKEKVLQQDPEQLEEVAA